MKQREEGREATGSGPMKTLWQKGMVMDRNVDQGMALATSFEFYRFKHMWPDRRLNAIDLPENSPTLTMYGIQMNRETRKTILGQRLALLLSLMSESNLFLVSQPQDLKSSLSST